MKSMKRMKSMKSMKQSIVTVIMTALVMVCGVAKFALAQGYEPVADKDPTTIAANPFIAGAYGFIWVAVVVYVVMLARGLAKANAEVSNLRSKLDSHSRG